MHTFVITRPFRWTSDVGLRRLSSLRTIAYFISVLGVLGVSLAVLISTGTPQQTATLAILGGTLAATPYVIARAIEEFITESGRGQ